MITFKKLFTRKRVVEEEISIPSDGKFYGNTLELRKSIDRNISCATAETLGFNPDELSEEELDDFSELGWVLYWMARGFHISEEELERYKETGHF